MVVLQLLCLLITANGAPVLAQWLLREWGAAPIDGGRILRDGYPLLGTSKTWRGLAAALLATPLAALLVGVDALTGIL
ncbi:MAG TPA: CDP-archaeol synthase, partial [Gammaproteobacteria bacterium]|nr:CDP-archaeol synthase [Gammaproteobacteria bacterium]